MYICVNLVYHVRTLNQPGINSILLPPTPKGLTNKQDIIYDSAMNEVVLVGCCCVIFSMIYTVGHHSKESKF